MMWIYHLPLGALGALFTLGSVAVGLSGVALCWRFGWRVNGDDQETAGHLHAFVGVVYAVALGLIAVSVQQEYDHVDHTVLFEASKTGNVFRNLEGLNAATRDPLQREVANYVQHVIEVEWPATQRGGTSEDTWRLVDDLARKIITLKPEQDGHQELVYPQLLSDVNDLLDARRTRLHLGHQGLSVVTWITIALGAVVTLGFACAFHMRSFRAQLALTSLMAAIFGLMISLIVAMDRPLLGSFSVKPDAFRTLLRNFERVLDEEGRTLTRR